MLTVIVDGRRAMSLHSVAQAVDAKNRAATAAAPASFAELVAYAEEERAARAAVIDELARTVDALRSKVIALGGSV